MDPYTTNVSPRHQPSGFRFCLGRSLRWSADRRVSSILAIALLSAFVVSATQTMHAQTETVLYTFTGGADGDNPQAGLVLRAGNLYGTDFSNGTSGYGTVFEVTKAKVETVLHKFIGTPDGSDPQAGLIKDTLGNLYGTTSGGGAYGYGSVFEISMSGVETVLYSFTGKADGGLPQGSLVRDSKGNLYGVTPYGGATFGSQSCEIGCGAVYMVTPAGVENVLYSFTGSRDGGYPYAGMVLAGGSLYGIANAGGMYGFGAVFKVTVPGKTMSGKETVLYSFKGGADGGSPEGNLVRDSKGNLYGTTFSGGNSVGTPGCTDGCGTVFQLAPSGVETVLYSFTGGVDGGYPFTGVIRDTAGNLYGTTPYGGSANFGTVFELPVAASEKVLYSFSGGADGANPAGGLVRDSIGNLYGTTYAGGNFNCAGGCGVVFKVAP
jgi:uncharacterized repeat protein (TIGR03803 family)